METANNEKGEAAEESAAYRTAWNDEADRKASGIAPGAASPASIGAKATGPEPGLIVQMIDSENLNLAWRKVRQNKGAAGVDGLDIEATMKMLREDRQRIEAQLLAGTYVPSPVRRVEIPKANGGTRKLGVPTVTDRWIQQAILQVIGPLFEAGFSEHSYGFRPGRSAHQAVLAAREHQARGKRWVVDIDLASFFDEVNHDLLIAKVKRRVKDVRVIKLIRAYLNAGVMIGGLVQPTEKGTPQGGPLSPLLSNILLDELDTELETRGHAFCRYADDCNIYVATKRSGERAMASVTRFLEEQMKLKVNREKSAVDRPVNPVFLGYSFTAHQEPKIRVPQKTCQKMREKLKERFRTGRGRKLETVIQKELNPQLRGWMNYFRLSETKRFAGGHSYTGDTKPLNNLIVGFIVCQTPKVWRLRKPIGGEILKRSYAGGPVSVVHGSLENEFIERLEAGQFRQARDAQQWIKKRTRKTLTESGVRKILRRLGGKLKVPRKSHAKKNQAKADAFTLELAQKLDHVVGSAPE